ncbi:MAG: CRISPR-associated RAMP Cmr4 [Candidatus Carbobacillus altaicus]|uniref:CRISPR-associated RAMP Cmr4 n=1 Tax=Candidatus Carbonibacillus altaicus TaxID=2163959 RepID=A0A2R6Y3R6_9BACL|nr:MAG: CRISPR-associated RAMP Cmr4 [Candidatus Carbobacillus altaicus]
MTHQTGNFRKFSRAGLAIDPIHVGTGGSRLGSVDHTIVRDPISKIPKIPGSTLAGMIRSYAAMAKEKYPNCAGLGQPKADGSGGHCGEPTCPICTTFGFSKDEGFAGLASFSDMSVLLFPVATREGPVWVTAPIALRFTDHRDLQDLYALEKEAIHFLSKKEIRTDKPLNLGWLLFEVKSDWGKGASIQDFLFRLKVPDYIISKTVVVSDKVFQHVINSNLEVRTSVSIDPTTGAAEKGKLFTYEALPRGTVLYWDVTVRNPQHFLIRGEEIKLKEDTEQKTEIKDVCNVVSSAHPYLESLGLGGMVTRGMGRLRVLESDCSDASTNTEAPSGDDNDRKDSMGGR